MASNTPAVISASTLGQALASEESNGNNLVISVDVYKKSDARGAVRERMPLACALRRPAEKLVSRTDLFPPIRRGSVSTSCGIIERARCCERAPDRCGNQFATPRRSAILWSMNRAVVGQPSWLPVLRASLPAKHLGGRDAARTTGSKPALRGFPGSSPQPTSNPAPPFMVPSLSRSLGTGGFPSSGRMTRANKEHHPLHRRCFAKFCATFRRFFLCKESRTNYNLNPVASLPREKGIRWRSGKGKL